jgi:hypothetical protein
MTGSEFRMLKQENARLQEQVEMLKRQIWVAQGNNERRNKELDALHYVWCNGGCEGGVHRWQEEEVSKELVETAIGHITRLVQWWNNREYKASYAEEGVELPELKMKDRVTYAREIMDNLGGENAALEEALEGAQKRIKDLEEGFDAPCDCGVY